MRRSVRRGRRLHPARDWLASAVLLTLAFAVGLNCLPRRPTQLAAAIDLADPQRAGTGIAPAVFALRDSGAAVRFGNAELTAQGMIRVGFYDNLDPLLATATEAVSLPADARLLWLLASPQERQSLREKAASLAVAVTAGARDVLGSREFATHYRDRFMDVFQAGTRKAWQVTQDNGAWRALIRSYEPIMRDLAARDIRPAIERHFRSVPVAMLTANAIGFIDPFRDHPWNMQPIENALKAAVQEMRDHDVPERAFLRLMEAPQTIEFLRVFQDEFVKATMHDPALQGLLAEMAFDERFQPYVADALSRANDLGRAGPRLLVSLHGSKELNLVASTVVRTTVSGRPDRVVVFMNPGQRDEIAALDRTAVHALARMDPSRGQK
jgi:hypothetical protein